MTYEQYCFEVSTILRTKYRMKMADLDISPLRDWFIRGESAAEAARLLAIKDGFPI